MGYGIEFKEGYMGAVAWDGENSHKGLWGADLSKAIREELKANGIKGVSVSCKHCDELYLKFKASEEDFKSFEEFLAEYSIEDMGHWYWLNGENKHINSFWDLSAEDRQKAMEESARHDYDYYRNGENSLNERHLEIYKMFSDAFMDKVKKAKMIVDSYNYDDSNAMVDYFNRGFYEYYYVKYQQKKEKAA